MKQRLPEITARASVACLESNCLNYDTKFAQNCCAAGREVSLLARCIAPATTSNEEPGE